MSSRSTLEDISPEEPLSPFQSTARSIRSTRSSRTNRSRHPNYIEEEAETPFDLDPSPTINEDDFDMLSNPRYTMHSMLSASSRGTTATARRPEVTKLRFKVHAGDVRYIMTSVHVGFPELAEKVREKFMVQGRFKIKVKDEDMPDGDMITVGDQDDLDMVIQTSKALARKQRVDTARVEVINPPPSAFCEHILTLIFFRSGLSLHKKIPL